MNYKIEFYKKADRDWEKIKVIPVLRKKTIDILRLLEDNPLAYPPEYERLEGELKGLYSRRLNKQHRLVYEVLKKEKTVRILSMWTHYE